ncbi:acyl carrier protein [uncultured Parasphingorhabdus sp.]|uniref:acyl carrier protein n=1 Tax=uncultured Parasphingorhabdus sp. TaxID=2709694 RepID=UPI0030D6E090|tara:strand:+ start:141378 stop:141602 length:225 start_codon:yes stop_codon:yes gene_type:complete
MMNDKFNEELADTMEIEVSQLTKDYELEESENWDSMTIVTTIALIDEHFGKSIDGEKLADCKTLGDIYGLIEAS